MAKKLFSDYDGAPYNTQKNRRNVILVFFVCRYDNTFSFCTPEAVGFGHRAATEVRHFLGAKPFFL